MCRLIKYCLVGIVVMVGSGLLLGNHLRWWGLGVIKGGQEAIWDAVSLDSKLKMARVALGELRPKVGVLTKQIVLAEFAVAKIAVRVQEYQDGMSYSRGKILHEKADLAEALKSGKKFLVYSGTEHSLSDVEKDLAKKFEDFEANELILRDLKKTLAIQELILENARKALDNSERAGQTLTTKVALLEVRLEAVKTMPDSVLADANGDLRALVNDIDASTTALERQNGSGVAPFSGGITIPDPQQTDDLLKAIDAKFKKS